jgi:hypothetical protein
MSEHLTEHATTPVVNDLPHSRLILVICRNRDLQRLTREFREWQEIGFHLIASGTTPKRFDGFLLIAWREKPVTRAFLDKIRNDTAIFEYIPINLFATAG